ncbi:MAG: hypothetical protein GQE15_04055 [Archangiaceae bacterium]|nr:hypothetical protein [Archangiaceae bacterium]
MLYRTEDIATEELGQLFVETQLDRRIIDSLKERTPVVLVGSRGVGKSFLLRVAQAELNATITTNRVLPVYVSFSRTSLIQTSDPLQFQHWMMARMCHQLQRTLAKSGFVTQPTSVLSGVLGSFSSSPSKLEQIMSQYEESWKTPGQQVDPTGIPDADMFLDAIEEICSQVSLSRISFFVDEAAHVLVPAQQRQFFTLFRDLRSPRLTCNAAVYPGLTSFGDTFQPSHDATMLALDRDILAPDYIESMKEIVSKQAQKQDDTSLIRALTAHGASFSVLAYAAFGNPRTLLKTIARAGKIGSSQVNETVREYFRTDIWSEHSKLAETFAGYRRYVDWGRKFIEDTLLPELKRKNDAGLSTDKSTSCYFWIHRDAPQSIKEALRLLAYTGIVSENSTGIRATRAEIGTRYAVNLGCLLSVEATPTTTGLPIAAGLTPKRMTEFGQNHAAFADIANVSAVLDSADARLLLADQLAKSVTVLDLPKWQLDGLLKIGISTLGEVLGTDESTFKKIPMVGDIRARRIMNAAHEAVFEYLSG